MQRNCDSGARAAATRAAATALAAATTLAVAVVATGAAAAGAATRLPAHARAVQRTDEAGTVWLCRPGLAADPCTRSLDTTSVAADGAGTAQEATPATRSPFDCFYVYPTVSTERTANANLQVQASEVDAAWAQASQFSQVCRVWAPMYRQATLETLAKGIPDGNAHVTEVAYESLLSAWRDYLEHDNDGRPIVFIGHSQGAALLIRLLESQVDPDPALRARTLVAILAGGNLQVPTGRTVGATFKHLPLCTRSGETGCVIAWSSFPSEPPATALFGRPGQGASLQSGQTATTGQQVACVNPASLGGGTADLVPYFLTPTQQGLPTTVTTPWVTYPGLYSARCTSAGGATWLQVDVVTASGTRPVVTETVGPTWGYHVNDVGLALGNLVGDVSAAEAVYTSAHH